MKDSEEDTIEEQAMHTEPMRLDAIHQLTAKEIVMYRRMTPEQRVNMSLRLSDAWRSRIVAGVRRRHPHYTEPQIRKAVLLLMQGKEVFQTVYPGEEIEP